MEVTRDFEGTYSLMKKETIGLDASWEEFIFLVSSAEKAEMFNYQIFAIMEQCYQGGHFEELAHVTKGAVKWFNRYLKKIDYY